MLKEALEETVGHWQLPDAEGCAGLVIPLGLPKCRYYA